MSDLSLTRRRFIDILTSPACQKIDFWCGGMHVSGAGFTLVAHALDLGGVRKGRGIGISIEKMEKGAAAAYDQFINAFAVPRRSWAKMDAFERLAVVHEAVHALRDIQGRTVTYEGKSFRPRGATDEATAYVGGCLYDVYVQQAGGKAASQNPVWLGKVKASVHAVAYAVAMRQAAKSAGSALSREDLATLFRAVTVSMRANTGGVPRFYEFNGVRGIRTSPP